MASATTIYDFKPLDSMLNPTSLHLMPIQYSIRREWFENLWVGANDACVIEKGAEVPLSEYKGKVLLIVNTASKCGFTPQYEGLEKLYKSVKEKYPDGFEILGFPSNQFGAQEPGTDDEIQYVCPINPSLYTHPYPQIPAPTSYLNPLKAQINVLWWKLMYYK